MTNIVCLSATISASLICNAFALIFIFRKNDERNLKDKIIGFLCCINGCQTIGYAVELHAAINGRATQVHIFWRELLLYFGRTIAVSEYSLKFPWKRYVGIFENLESKNKTWLFTDRTLKKWFIHCYLYWWYFDEFSKNSVEDVTLRPNLTSLRYFTSQSHL